MHILSKSTYQSSVLINRSNVQNCFIVFVASIVLAVISQIALPWVPVPLTFQSAMVVLLGVTLGSQRASLAVALYLLEGACGLPVFSAGSAGFHVLVGPTAGYLWGFLPAAFFTGWMMEKGMASSFFRILITTFMGTGILFSLGALHLQTLIGWKNAYHYGVQPFLLVESMKLVLVSGLGKLSFKKM